VPFGEVKDPRFGPVVLYVFVLGDDGDVSDVSDHGDVGDVGDVGDDGDDGDHPTSELGPDGNER
jgi:hypothetical protein